MGEAETAGVILNVIPRDGGNTFSGTVRVISGANGSMQGSNYTDELKDAGLRSPQELIKVWEFNPMGGGRIVRDKLWFYVTYREVVRREHDSRHVLQQERRRSDEVARRLRHQPRPAFNDSVTRNAIARLTWQVSPRNKISFSHSEQYSQTEQDGRRIRDADT